MVNYARLLKVLCHQTYVNIAALIVRNKPKKKRKKMKIKQCQKKGQSNYELESKPCNEDIGTCTGWMYLRRLPMEKSPLMNSEQCNVK